MVSVFVPVRKSRSRMIRGEVVNPFMLHTFPQDRTKRFPGPGWAVSYCHTSKQKNIFRPNKPYLFLHPRTTCTDFCDSWFSVCRRVTTNCISDVYVISLYPVFFEGTIQYSAGTAQERFALVVFTTTGRLSNDHDLRGYGSSPHQANSLCILVERASCTVSVGLYRRH